MTRPAVESAASAPEPLAAARLRDRERLGDAPFTVIANDCWGAEIYRWLDLPYTTPLVGTFIEGPDYLRLVRDPRGVLTRPLHVDDELGADAGHPVARLGDVTVHFLHHADADAAATSWSRRLARVEWSALRMKSAIGKDGFTTDIADAVAATASHVFTPSPTAGPGRTPVRDYCVDGMLLFARSLPTFDLVAWLRGDGVLPAQPYQRMAQP